MSTVRVLTQNLGGGSGAIVIGYGNEALSSSLGCNAIAIGLCVDSHTTMGGPSVIIGDHASDRSSVQSGCATRPSVVIGSNAYAGYGGKEVVIGPSAGIGPGGGGGVVIGAGAELPCGTGGSNAGGVAIGCEATACDAGNIAIGCGSHAGTMDSIVIGAESSQSKSSNEPETGSHGIVVGSGSAALKPGIVIGSGSSIDYLSSDSTPTDIEMYPIVIGHGTTAGANDIIIGNGIDGCTSINRCAYDLLPLTIISNSTVLSTLDIPDGAVIVGDVTCNSSVTTGIYMATPYNTGTDEQYGFSLTSEAFTLYVGSQSTSIPSSEFYDKFVELFGGSN